jgi:hypothetical protein
MEDIMKTIKDVGSLAYMVDKWDVKKSEKGHKLVDYAGRCVAIPDDAAAHTGKLVGKYEYLPDGSWKGSGTCTYTYEGGDELNESWEEDANKGTYKYTGGTGKYAGASGGGTYTVEELTDTLAGGKHKGAIELP